MRQKFSGVPQASSTELGPTEFVRDQSDASQIPPSRCRFVPNRRGRLQKQRTPQRGQRSLHLAALEQTARCELRVTRSPLGETAPTAASARRPKPRHRRTSTWCPDEKPATKSARWAAPWRTKQTMEGNLVTPPNGPEETVYVPSVCQIGQWKLLVQKVVAASASPEESLHYP